MFQLNSTIAAAISHALDVCALRHQIYSANIANASVQGYQRLELAQNSAASLQAVTGSAEVHAPQVVSTHDAVKLDQEMSKLAQNALRYETLLTAYEKTGGILRMAIREGRGE